MPPKKDPRIPRGVFQRADGVWCARFRDANGELHREVADSLHDAVLLHARRRDEIKRGTFDASSIRGGRKKRYASSSTMTMAELIDSWMAESRATKRSASDDERYARIWKDELGWRKPLEVTAEEVRRWRRRYLQTPTRRGKPPAPASANRIVSFLRRVFNAAIEAGIDIKNPCTRLKMLPEENEQIGLLEDEQEAVLRQHVRPELWPLVEIALHVGLREEEQFSLKRSQVKLERAVIHLPKNKKRKGRTVRLNSRAVELLRAQLASHESEWVFPSPRDPRKHRNASSFYHKVWEKALKDAGLPHLRWHDLRATCATRMLEEGATMEEVRDHLGHSTLTMVQRYARLVEKRQLAAVERLASRHQAAARPKPARWSSGTFVTKVQRPENEKKPPPEGEGETRREAV